MPTTYAHWRFGDTCLKTLPKPARRIAEAYRPLYDIGAQGPDVFFHCPVIRRGEVARYGSRLHHTPMRETLKGFRQNWLLAGNRDEALAYLLGFLAHFMLDSYCHGYIELKALREGPSHNKIESQYDRHLMLQDGHDPYRTKVTFSLHPSASAARMMAQLYGTWDEKIMNKSVKNQIFYRDLLRDSNSFKRTFLSTAMKIIGARKFEDMMMGPEELPLCIASNQRLDKYFRAAAEHYASLAENLQAFFTGGTEPDPYFDHDFGPKKDWESIPVLGPEQESEYEAGLQQ